MIFDKLCKVVTNMNLTIHLGDGELIIYQKDILIAKTKTMKSKILFQIIKYPDNLDNFNPLYEEFKDKKILIELHDNYKIWSIIQNRLGSFTELS